MKTTRMAQYPAEAANSSCRFAAVSMLMAAQKRRVKTTRTPMAAKVPCCEAAGLSGLAPLLAVSLYMPKTGRTSRTKMTNVISSPTKSSTRFEL